MTEILKSGVLDIKDLNCAETILTAANMRYKLGLTPDIIKLSSGFGGGMGVEKTCGALCGAVMVLGNLFVKERAHEGETIRELTGELLNTFSSEYGTIECSDLKEEYRDEVTGCKPVIILAAGILETIINREKRKESFSG